MNRRFRNILFSICVAGLPLSVFASPDLSAVLVYPNPARADLGDGEIVFNNLTDQAVIKIFTVNGSLVREITLPSSGTLYRWNMKNDSGFNTATGVYLYVISNDAGERRKGKLAIIR